MNPRWSLVFLFVLLPASPSLGDEVFKFTSSDQKLKRGNTVKTRLYTSDNKITITKVEVENPHDFEVKPESFNGPPVEGSKGVEFEIHRGFFTKPGGGGPRAGKQQIEFLVEYTIAGDPQTHRESIKYQFVYSTHVILYFLCGFLGLLLGYIVKSIITKQGEKAADGSPVKGSYLNYMFVKNLPRLVIILILGFAALLYFEYQGDSVFGWAESVLLGLGIGLMGDETLVQKIQGTVKMGS
jgi:hypothetical protein